MSDNKFSNGFLLGLIVGGGAVFLLGTRTGKNLLKIVSEQGLDGIINILDEYDLSEIEQEEEEDRGESFVSKRDDYKANGQAVVKESQSPIKEESPKKRFFRRVKK